ncbi:LacI family DNA-binding transcriptional regulator, partial [Selenomonas sp.]|uniref:LacI family DNA-binding transcriptional regulator n=1 Tax=Selenomonas sp. TaxID=2053611 RepID=UPI001CAAF758
MKATIIDVAREAGVSVATVSRVVNGSYPVREKTREKVERAIAKLEYVPNLQARELNTQRSSSIGVVVPGFDNMFFAEVLDGVEEHLRQSSYSLLLACAQNDPQREEACVRDFITRNVSGVIVVSPNTETAATKFYETTAARLPMVFINSAREIPGISYVTSDQRGGARAALEHLFDYGHERILFVRGENSDSYRVKEDVYRAVMQERGLF